MSCLLTIKSQGKMKTFSLFFSRLVLKRRFSFPWLSSYQGRDISRHKPDIVNWLFKRCLFLMENCDFPFQCWEVEVASGRAQLLSSGQRKHAEGTLAALLLSKARGTPGSCSLWLLKGTGRTVFPGFTRQEQALVLKSQQANKSEKPQVRAASRYNFAGSGGC